MMTTLDKLVFVARLLLYRLLRFTQRVTRGSPSSDRPTPELLALNKFFRGNKRRVSSAYDLVDMRKELCSDSALERSSKIESFGKFSLEWRGNPQGARLILAVPGGGFFLPPMDHHRSFLDRVGSRFDARIAIVRHRLSPETPFPAAYDDVLAALDIVLSSTQYRRVDAIADSSGGALLLSAMMARRNQEMTLPTRVVLCSPATDFAMTGLSNVNNAENDPMFGPQALIHKAFHYLQGANPTDIRVSPLWGAAQGLPPLLMFAGSGEVMLDDTLRFAEKVRAAGGKVDTSIYEETPHCFVYMAGIPEAEDAFREVCNFISDS